MRKSNTGIFDPRKAKLGNDAHKERLLRRSIYVIRHMMHNGIPINIESYKYSCRAIYPEFKKFTPYHKVLPLFSDTELIFLPKIKQLQLQYNNVDKYKINDIDYNIKIKTAINKDGKYKYAKTRAELLQNLSEGWSLGTGTNIMQNKVLINKNGKTIYINAVDLDEHLLNGWQRGNANVGKTKSVNKDGINKTVNLADLDKHLSEGWSLGRRKYKI
ncbi:hypothetical protein MA9V1_078 [Chryseobacterium phage MA9V-1]|nr:hypothetical protein MA9V1_078 [Chryseobacterium phage MA9V-1]